MGKRKLLCAALAAMLVCGSVSTVSFAETAATEESTTEQTWTDEDGITWKNPFEIREEESKYSITLENAVVDGKEKVAVKLSGLPKEMFTYDFDFRMDDPNNSNRYYYQKLKGFYTTIDIDNKFLCFRYNQDITGAITCNIVKVWAYNPANYDIIDYTHNYLIILDDFYLDYNDQFPTADAQIIEGGDALSLVAYVDDDELVEALTLKNQVTVFVGADINGTYASYSDNNAPGTYGILNYIYSDGTIVVDPFDRAEPCKENVKVTNNLNTADETSNTSEPTSSDTSKPTESTVTPGGTDPVSEPDSSTNEQTVLEVTLKNVDSENGIEGTKLDELLFGESGWTWDQVEKIVFTSDKLFSVQYTAVDGSTKTLGEEEAARTAAGGIWNTEWTLDTSLMSKNKSFVKLIAKDGTADIKATIYIKKDAAKPSTDGDQANTGIALAIAPIALAASVVIVASKKKK